MTCAELPALDPDDRPLADALAALGCAVEPCVWDDEDVAWETFDLVLVRSPWDYAERRAAFVRWAERVAERTTLHNPAEVIAWNTDKRYLRALAADGVPTIPTAWVPAGRPAPRLADLLAERGWREAIVKPTVGAGSSGLVRVDDGDRDGAGAAALAALVRTADAMVQPFLPSIVAEGELSLVFLDGAFSHAVRKRPAAGDFRVQPEFGATAVPVTPSAAELAVAGAALATLDAERLLYARVDLVSDADGAPLVIELEVTEPALYLAQAPGAAERLARRVRDLARTATAAR